MDLIYDMSTMLQEMAWCHQATCHYLSQCWPCSALPHSITKAMNIRQNGLVLSLNSSDAGDGILRFWGSIPSLLMHWLLKSPVHQQAWYYLYRKDNMYCCSRVNVIYLGQAKSKIQFKMNISFIIFQTIQHVKSRYLHCPVPYSPVSVSVWLGQDSVIDEQ